MKADLVIKNGHLVSPAGITKGLGIAIKGGKITSVCDEAFLPEADTVIDAHGNHILPGAKLRVDSEKVHDGKSIIRGVRKER